jgi:hypothetical protein
VKVKRRAAVVRVELQPGEAELLERLLDDLDELLAAADHDDPVVQRLFPDGYSDDEAASAEFAQLVGDDLRTERTGRTQACRAELASADTRLALTDEAADRWIRVLNDLRLALGTRLGVSEDAELDPRDEAAAVYHWLSAAQELLVDALMG